MRTLRVVASKPWLSATVLGLIAVTIVETVAGGGLGGFAFGVLGALVGLIALPMITQLGLLIGSAVFGLRVRHVELGAMSSLVSWTWRRTTFTVRALPVVLSSEIGPWRSPVILRCWLAGLTSAIAGVAAVGSVWWLVDGSFWRGVLVAVTPMMISKLWPRRAPLTTSTGWLLFGLPRMPEPKRTEFCAGPYAARSYELLKSGDVDAAQAVVDELAAAHPDLNTTNSCQVTMLEARGEYAQGVALLLGYMSTHEIPPRELSYTLAGLAGLGLPRMPEPKRTRCCRSRGKPSPMPSRSATRSSSSAARRHCWHCWHCWHCSRTIPSGRSSLPKPARITRPARCHEPTIT